MTDIQINTNTKDFQHFQASQVIRNRALPYNSIISKSGTGILYLCIPLFIVLDQHVFGVPIIYLFVTGLLLWLVGFLRQMIWTSSVRRSVANSGSQNADWQFTLSKNGFRRERDGHYEFSEWRHFDEALKSSNGIVLMQSKGEFISIPTSNLSAGVSSDDLYEKIVSWISESQ